MASNLIVLAFDTEDGAQSLLDALTAGKKEGLLSIDDAAVVVKDEKGKVHTKNRVSKGTLISTGVGGLLGLLIAGIFMPLGALFLGLGGGALVGRLLDMGVDGKFVKEVGDEITPGTSALFMLVSNVNAAGVRSILNEHKGKVLQTNLSSEAEENLRKAVGDEGAS